MAGTTGTAPTQQTVEDMRAEVLRMIDEAQAITDDALASERDLTATELTKVDDLMLKAEGMNGRVKRIKARTSGGAGETRDTGFGTSSANIKALFDGSNGSYSPTTTKAKKGAAWGAKVVTECSDGNRRFKGVTPSGSVLVAVPQPDAVEMGRPVAALRSLLPAESTDGYFAFLRQTVRTNNAAPVAAGALKPTSTYNFDRVEDRARTIAHLSSPIHRADISDAPMLQQLISDEMTHGLEQALAAQILSGDGVGENIAGLSVTAGVQTVALLPGGDDNAMLRTLRRAITRLEVLGLEPTGFAMSPSDWEDVEMASATDGSLILSSAGQAVPIDRSARRLWGVPVVATPSCPPGVAWLADWAGSTKLFVREEAQLSWSEGLYDPNLLGAGQGGNLFAVNELVFRVEGRFGFAVTRPTGVVKISLTA